MPQGFQALVALFMLLPGFISARIVRLMTSRSQQTELERVIEALIFSFFTYVIYFLCCGLKSPIEWTPVNNSGIFNYWPTSIHRWKILLLVFIPMALGLCWGYVQGHDLLSRLLRRLKMTERTSRDSVWNDVFLSLSGTVQIGLADGRSVIGWLGRYSDTDNERSLFLERAYWVGANGEDLIPIPGSGLLLTEKSEIQFVMFLDEKK